MKDSPLIHSLSDNNSVRDESLYTGYAFSASSPKTADEVKQVIRYCTDNGITITPHGGLTGINGAGTATRNHSMNLKQLTGTSYRAEDNTLWVLSGTTFSEIETAVRKESHMSREFPASPTEKSATIGGALSFGARGLRSYKYGSVSDFVTEIEFCDCSGSFHLYNPADGNFRDLFGSEGMLGVITGVRIRTVPIPKALWGLMFFFPDNACAAGFSDAITATENISVFELFDSKSFELLHEFRSQISSISRIPELPVSNQAAVYLELESDCEEALEETAGYLLDLTAKYQGDPDTVWNVVGDETDSFRLMRHAVSECINLKIASFHAQDVQIKKLSCACLFPDKTRLELIQYYQDSLAENCLSGVIFGHIGSKNPYVNILPHSADEYHKARALIEKWCRDSFESGGRAFSECGVGKLYRDIFQHTAPIELLNKRIKLKHKWDPDGLFNPKNMLVQK